MQEARGERKRRARLDRGRGPRRAEKARVKQPGGLNKRQSYSPKSWAACKRMTGPAADEQWPVAAAAPGGVEQRQSTNRPRRRLAAGSGEQELLGRRVL